MSTPRLDNTTTEIIGHLPGILVTIDAPLTKSRTHKMTFRIERGYNHPSIQGYGAHPTMHLDMEQFTRIGYNGERYNVLLLRTDRDRSTYTGDGTDAAGYNYGEPAPAPGGVGFRGWDMPELSFEARPGYGDVWHTLHMRVRSGAGWEAAPSPALRAWIEENILPAITEAIEAHHERLETEARGKVAYAVKSAATEMLKRVQALHAQALIDAAEILTGKAGK